MTATDAPSRLTPKDYRDVYDACDTLRQAINRDDGYREACEEAHGNLRRILGFGPWDTIAGTTYDSADDVGSCGGCGADLRPSTSFPWHYPDEDCRAIRQPS